MKTILKAAAIALILCVTMMSGCIDDAKDSIIDKAIERATGNVLYGVTFEGGQRANPDPLRVMIYEDGTALVINDESMTYGEWETPRQIQDYPIYDITYDTRELSISLKDNNVAYAHVYSDGFTKCGEEFRGTWTDVSALTADGPYVTKPTRTPTPVVKATIDSNKFDAMPKTAMIAGGTSHESDLKRYILFEGGSVELCTSGDIISGTWKWVHRTPTTRTYTITTTDQYTSEIYKTDLIMNHNGTAELILVSGRSYYGTWTEGIDRSRGTCDPAIATPTPKTTSKLSPLASEGIPMTAMIKGALPDDTIRFILEDDGTFEMYARDEYTYGTYKLTVVQNDRRSYSLDMEPHCTLARYGDGSAKLSVEGSPVQFKGTWIEGAWR